MSRFERIERVRETGSTNDDMAQILGEERARGLTLVADYQRSGAGRKGRTWIAQPGSALLCTIALPDSIATARLWAVPFWIALVLRSAVARFGVQTILQWPNDVLFQRQKLAGILCVSRVTGDRAWVGCGVGVNVKRPEDAAKVAQIQPSPAFLSDGANVERDDLLRSLLEEADRSYADLETPEKIVANWNAAANLPAAYRVAIDGEPQPFDAMALRLLEGGALLVERAGVKREIHLADARILRD